ncbi:hypothetical protein P4K08_00115 [Bacillus cereus]|nr:Hypothetical protein NF53_p5159 [Bacillus thuringiensis serovar indiana]MEB9640625.1 hypothetical protein [Bacillus cereus]MEB9643990.1 hypothetical protein [Bacillus cereus]
MPLNPPKPETIISTEFPLKFVVTVPPVFVANVIIAPALSVAPVDPALTVNGGIGGR